MKTYVVNCAVLLAVCLGTPAFGQTAKSAILFIGDGMAQAQVTAGRIYKGNARDGKLNVDTIRDVAFVRTYSDNSAVTDSAASATAYATGHKTTNGYVGVDTEGQPLETLLEAAKKAGKSVGVVSTARVTHATPACFVSHLKNRNDEQSIAAQMIDAGIADLIMGGGKENFLPKDAIDGESGNTGGRRDDRNLVEDAKAKGYVYVEKLIDFNALRKSVEAGTAPEKVLALFSMSHMSYEVERANDAWGEPSLADMTDFAISLLSRNPKGFFLMIEGGRVDHANHQNQALKATTDFIAYDDAIGVGLAWVARDPGLFFVATADHETGGMAVNGYPDIDIQGIELFASPSQFGRPDIITYATGPGAKRDEYDAMSKTDPGYSQPALRFMGSAAHTGVDVPAWSAGAGSDRIGGTLNNTEIHDIIGELIGLK